MGGLQQPEGASPDLTIDLDLTLLGERCALSTGLLACVAEAASVRLHHHHGAGPATGEWEQPPMYRIVLHWTVPDERTRATHRNTIDATEDAAYAVAFLAAHALGFKVVGRAEHGTGADWLMERAGDPEVYRLEVSGIDASDGKIETRLKVKVDQLGAGSSRSPGVAVVFRIADATLRSAPWPPK